MGAGVELEASSHGEGAATVLVHGMARRFADAELPGRAIAYDRRGYGESEAPDPYTQTTVNEQAEDLACVVRGLDVAPALLVGADVGALAVVDVLLRHPGVARGAVLVDPPLYQFVPEATEALSAERQALEAELRGGGGPAAAVSAWLGMRGHESPRESSRDAIAFFADYGAVSTLEISRRQLRSLSVPLAVVVSPGAPEHVRGAADALLGLLSSADEHASWQDAVRALS